MKWIGTLGGLLTGVLTVACGSSLPHPTYSAQAASALEVVSRPPPPARVESVPPSPTKGAVWVDGEWVWAHERWSWLPGRWVRPVEGATFSPWVVVRGADGTLYVARGLWKDAAGHAIAAPPPLAIATVEAADVVDAQGDAVETGPTIHERVEK
jgi:hypothetical protein